MEAHALLDIDVSHYNAWCDLTKKQMYSFWTGHSTMFDLVLDGHPDWEVLPFETQWRIYKRYQRIHIKWTKKNPTSFEIMEMPCPEFIWNFVRDHKDKCNCYSGQDPHTDLRCCLCDPYLFDKIKADAMLPNPEEQAESEVADIVEEPEPESEVADIVEEPEPESEVADIVEAIVKPEPESEVADMVEEPDAAPEVADMVEEPEPESEVADMVEPIVEPDAATEVGTPKKAKRGRDEEESPSKRFMNEFNFDDETDWREFSIDFGMNPESVGNTADGDMFGNTSAEIPAPVATPDGKMITDVFNMFGGGNAIVPAGDMVGALFNAIPPAPVADPPPPPAPAPVDDIFAAPVGVRFEALLAVVDIPPLLPKNKRAQKRKHEGEEDEDQHGKPKKMTLTEYFAFHARGHSVDPAQYQEPTIRVSNLRFSANLKLAFQQDNPKQVGSNAYGRYEIYKQATTLAQFAALSTNRWQALRYDFHAGFVVLG